MYAVVGRRRRRQRCGEPEGDEDEDYLFGSNHFEVQGTPINGSQARARPHRSFFAAIPCCSPMLRIHVLQNETNLDVGERDDGHLTTRAAAAYCGFGNTKGLLSAYRA
jgi:hypothetical protein